MGAFSNLGSVYVEVGADLSALAKDLQGAVQDAAQAGQQIGQSLEQNITQATGPAAGGLHEVAGAAHEAEGGFLGLSEGAKEMAAVFGIGLGIEAVVEGLKSLAEGSIEAYGEIQLATVALTALTGSAESAKEVIESMKSLAMASIFPDEKLIKAAQEMANIGIAADTIPRAMKAVVDAAEGSGHSLESVSQAFERIVNSGEISNRTLNKLGINLNDLAETAHMTGEEVKQAFHDAGPDSAASLEILISTLQRTKSAAGDAVIGTLPNQINQLKVQLHDLMETIGEGSAGTVSTFIANIKGLGSAFDALLKSMSGSGDNGLSLGGILNEMGKDLASGFGLFASWKSALIGVTEVVDVLRGKYPDLATAEKAITDEVNKGTAATKESADALAKKTEATQKDKDAADAAAESLRQSAAAAANLKAVKELLTSATSLAAEAEKSFAEDMRALSIPAVKELGQAEADVAVTRAALVTADGIAKTALEALNAERAKAVPNAQILKQLEEDLKNATNSSALARIALKDAESALDLTRKTAKDAAAQISQDEQAHANYLKTVAVPTVMDYKTAMDAVNVAKNQAAVSDAALTTAEIAYNAAVKSGDPGAIATATLNLGTARAKLKTDTDAVKTSEDNLKKSQDAVTAATKEIQSIDKALDDFYLREMVPHLVNLKEAVFDVADAKRQATDAGENLRRIELDLEAAILNEGDATQHVKDLTSQAAAARVDFTNKTKNLHEIEQIVANDFGITVSQLHLLQDAQTAGTSSVKLLADAYEAAGIRTTAALQAEEAAANLAYKAITADPTAGLNQKLQALQKEIDAEIALDQSVPAEQQIQLAKMTQQETDYINNSAKRWTDLSNTIHNDVQGMFSGLIGDLFNGGDFLKTIEDTFKKIGESIVEAIFKPFTDLISQTIASLVTPLAKTLAGWISDALIAIFPGLAGALGAAVGGAATAAAVGANTTALGINTTALGELTAAISGAGVGSAAGGAGGVGGSGGAIGSAVSSGLAATVSAITGVVSAVTGVISVFQQARQENTLNAIEESTRYSALYLGARGDGGILGELFRIDEEISWGANTKATERIRDLLNDSGLSQIHQLLADGIPDMRQLLRDISTNVYTFLSQINDTLKNGIVKPQAAADLAQAASMPQLSPSMNSMNFNIPSPSDWLSGLSAVTLVINLDGKELFTSFAQWMEDNALIIPQGS